jgi:hypothetical protein
MIDCNDVVHWIDVFGTPIGALIGIPLAAKLAISGFRKQKVIERRLDWYEKIHRDISSLKHELALATSGEPANLREAETRFVLTSSEAALYAELHAYQAVWALRRELEKLSQDSGKQGATLDRVMRTAQLTQNASDTIAIEIRRLMQMSKLPK